MTNCIATVVIFDVSRTLAQNANKLFAGVGVLYGGKQAIATP